MTTRVSVVAHKETLISYTETVKTRARPRINTAKMPNAQSRCSVRLFGTVVGKTWAHDPCIRGPQAALRFWSLHMWVAAALPTWHSPPQPVRH